MKRTILTIVAIVAAILIVTGCATSIPITDANREVNNFRFNNGAISWQKVFQFNGQDYVAVRDWFNKSFIVTRENESSIIGETSENTLPIQEAGFDRLAVTMLMTYPCVVYFSTDFKDDRYRVTVNRIIWHPNIGITTYGVTNTIGAMDLNELALKGNAYNSVFYNTSSVQLDAMLSHLFTAKLNNTDTNDEW